MNNSTDKDLPLRIGINAQITQNSGAGGVESVLIGLIHALGKLEGPEEYIIITSWKDPEWIKHYIGPNEVIVPIPKHKETEKDMFLKIAGGLLGPARPMANKLVNKILQSMKQIGEKNKVKNKFSIPVSDGFYEQLGIDVIHFPYQSFIQTSLPSIFNPHDLQHLHYPQFFSKSIIEWRENMYPAGCHNSNMVVVASQWIKQDIAKHYKIYPPKIQVIPWAPPTLSLKSPTPKEIAEVKSKYPLNDPFAFYPAMTWEHKNHLRLLDAVAYLRDSENLIINLVCTGNKIPYFFPEIEERLAKLNLNNQVKFLGLLPNSELRAMYRLAQFVIVPTLFEAASGPVFEAWQEGTPVACSTVTSLPEQAGNAALLFNPNSTEAIADALKQMSTDQNLREELTKNGTKRLNDFSWELTAKAYRAVYRLVAGRPLTEEDKMLLNWDCMKKTKMEAQ